MSSGLCNNVQGVLGYDRCARRGAGRQVDRLTGHKWVRLWHSLNKLGTGGTVTRTVCHHGRLGAVPAGWTADRHGRLALFVALLDGLDKIEIRANAAE